jgi:hypothetical protein
MFMSLLRMSTSVELASLKPPVSVSTWLGSELNNIVITHRLSQGHMPHMLTRMLACAYLAHVQHMSTCVSQSEVPLATWKHPASNLAPVQGSLRLMFVNSTQSSSTVTTNVALFV